MQTIRLNQPIARSKLAELAEQQYGDMVKAVVDIELVVMVIGGELHADEEAVLLDDGSNQMNLWGINLHPFVTDENWIEFDSMINLRPRQGNRSRGVDDPGIRSRIRTVVDQLVTDS